jgi:hypothetical protein
MVLKGERFSRITITATGIAVIKKTMENICQKTLQCIVLIVFQKTQISVMLKIKTILKSFSY